jgi:hypothetical protein
MAPLYGLEQAHALLDDVCDLMGVGDTSRYMKQPDDPQVQQGLKMQSMMGQQMHQMEMQMQGLQMANQRLQIELAQSKDRQGWMKTETDAIYKQAQMMDMREDNELDEERLQLDRDRAAAEYEIERTQQRGAEI